MLKATKNSYEYDKSKLDWDPSQKSPTYKDRSSMKKKRERGVRLPPKSTLGGFIVDDNNCDEEEEEEGDDDMLESGVAAPCSRKKGSALASGTSRSRGGL
ncbi:hypothetical protein ONS95_008571 [Cadophora gregata]|uniref:uncharacterized protein n=1 Tax=Cadophora gregata TaxID=51156 RepID=UPI0026DC9E15|nr:uncharacterized protein ONS95_008571 [Cadophora gregata]KAK0099817.1 hypothetical protein ONS95_008571 [Cadophora gregata]KAK0123580.1 hypothetical protein ONS96_010558 [Cadophora gregata f. sp. sojae]